METILHDLLTDYRTGRSIDLAAGSPDAGAVEDFLKTMDSLVFPGGCPGEARTQMLLSTARYQLESLLKSEGSEDICRAFLRQIPQIRYGMQLDLEAFLAGDPAAAGPEEILACYPGYRAIFIYRLANALLALGVQGLPRQMTELAHSRTGIDIHPGATIGRYFFIDHGTGVVIGQTAEIADHVKLYQGVTLGALSTRKGRLLKGTKRHPTIESGVTIYAGATILGGDTVIGEGSTIGANAFLTTSVPPGSRIHGPGL